MDPDTTCADLLGLVPSQYYILIVQCLCSKYPVIQIVKSTSAEVVIPGTNQVPIDIGIPHKIRPDNGPTFSGYIFKEFTKEMAFKHARVTPFSPWARGTVELFMQNLRKNLKTSNVKNQD